MICQRRAFQHPQDDHPRPGLSVIVLDRAVGGEERPGVMGGFSEFLIALEGFDGGERARLRGRRCAGNRVFGAAVGEDIVKSGEGH